MQQEVSPAPRPPSPTRVLTEGLDDDIQLLGDLLFASIQRLAGQQALELEEEIRAAAKNLRNQPCVEDARRLRDRLDLLPLPALRTLIRGFSIYFDLINLAEQQARVRAIRQQTLRLAPAPMRESAEEAVREISTRVSAAQVADLLRRAMFCPVFTAHPSEARRRTVLEKLVTIARQLDRREYTQLLPSEREAATLAIATEIEAFWLTEIIRGERPTVLDEVRQGLEVVENSLFDVVPRVYRELEAALQRAYPDWQGPVPPFLRFGSWIGGDRDGNPAVTHDVTAQAIRLQQEMVFNHYLGRIQELGRQLSHSERQVQPGPAFMDSIARDAAVLPGVVSQMDDEPYRNKCRFIAAKLRLTLDHLRQLEPRWTAEGHHQPAGCYLNPDELHADVAIVADDLRLQGAQAAADGPIRDLLRLIEVFGTHLLTMDIRQHSVNHAQALDEILSWAGVCNRYGKLTPNERFDCLARELEQTRPLIPAHLPFSPTTQEVIQTFRTIEAVLEQQCPKAIDSYIISGVTEPAHILEVLLLAREARLFRPGENLSRINIVPLFESQEPLRQAATIIQRLLALPVYRRHLQLRGDLQEVMIGYSDSNKETGFMQSAWILYRAQRALNETNRRMGVRIQIFHGRGGAIGRGGGPANRAILAQPRGTIDGRLRITEQGEVIADRYGHPAIAARHLEQTINAVLRTSFAQADDRRDPTWDRLAERLAERACKHYQALVYHTPEFLTYFEQATPINEIAQLKIASRPARRGSADSGIEQLRAIPWVFSWMQSRHTLPGWYGLGSAVSEHLADSPGDLAVLQTMYRDWEFWRTLIDNAQMILAKADMTIARLYADLVTDQNLAAEMFGLISREHQRSVDAVCRITSQQNLLDNVPILQKSIQRRNPFVDPLSFIQLVMLQRLRSGVEPQCELMTGVLESVNGIASGLKNTG